MEYSHLRRIVCATAKRAWADGLVAGSSGNFSAFDPLSGAMGITPSGLAYDAMTPDDITVITLDGLTVAGAHRPSSEWRLHAAIYEARHDARAVAHTHSPYASAFAVLRESIPCVLIEMQVFLGGTVPCAPYAPVGTYALGRVTADALGHGTACLMANHGAVTVGATLDEAYLRAVYLEDTAKICHLARQIGTPTVL